MKPDKLKKKKAELSRKMQNKLRVEFRRWDQFTLLLALVIAVSCLVCYHRPYQLGEPAIHGFPLWFLLCTAYPLMELISLVNLVFDLSGSSLMRFLVSREVLALGLVDLLTLAAVWALWRFRLGSRFGVSVLRAAGTFLGIYLAWGAMQLLLFFLVFIWLHGGFAELHEHLQTPPPEPEIVEKAE